MKKYYILTLGCQMNKSDGERIARVLENLDYVKADDEKSADLIVINSCSVRQAAIDKIFGKIHSWNKEKARRQRDGDTPLVTILSGCVLSQDKKKFEKLFDLILDIKDLPRLPEMLSELEFDLADTPPCQGGTGSLPPDRGGLRGGKSHESNNYFSVKPIYQNPWSAFVPIMTGCNNFCTYCAVPYTRGREESRSVKEILDEVKALVDNGCLEVTLLGQNVNTYRPSDKESFSKDNPYKDLFAALLWEINQLAGLRWLHFTAPHPKDMTDEVVDALTLPNHVNYLHLPAQAGDDEILRRMNRNYTAADYITLVKKIRAKKPDIAISTDLIVGFPGETKEQFENTVKLYKEADFDISYTAKYSPREGTVAAKKFEDDVLLEEKKRRWKVMQEMMEEITLRKNQKYVGQVVEVLVAKKVESKKRGDEYLYEGNSREYKKVRFYSSKDLLGKIVKVKVDKAMIWLLEGEIE